MSYSQVITRANPTCILFLIDQSGSMADPFPAGRKSKSTALADAINNLLRNLSLKCTKEDGIRDYYHIGVIGYSGDTVKSAFGGKLANEYEYLFSISEIADNPYRIEERLKSEDDGAGGIFQKKIKFPIWFEPSANGGTPMCKAFKKAHSILADWVKQYPNSFPPVVMNFTDGESTDGNPTLDAQTLQKLATNDGNVLVFNAHLSSTKSVPILYPDNETILPDKYANLLFNISSRLPSRLREFAQDLGLQVSVNSKGFVLNAELVDIIHFLSVGTPAAQEYYS